MALRALNKHIKKDTFKTSELSLARSIGTTGSPLVITRMLIFISTYPGNISGLFFLERSVRICFSTIQGQQVHRDSIITSETQGAQDICLSKCFSDLFKGISVGDICVAASWSSPQTFIRFYYGCHCAYYGSCSS